jgi:DNA polymerase (family 10)
MSDSKSNLIAALKECAVLMELRGENPFRCRAYENGARVMEGLQGGPEDWLKPGALEGVKGIGKGLHDAIEEWVAGGRLELLDELRAEIPAGLVEMLSIPGLGAKKVKALWEKLGVDSIDKLEAAARGEELAELPGFGAKTAEKILTGIDRRRRFSERRRIDVAAAAAAPVLELLRGLKCVHRVELGGSLRRRRETIKDLDFVVDSEAPEEVMEAFVTAPGVERVVNRGETKSSVLFAGGIPSDLRVVEPDQFTAALNYFTGSKEHNTALRGRAKKMGLKLNEYGLFKEDTGRAIKLPDEAALYKRLGLVYIEPELREDTGEIEAAEAEAGGERALPKLIESSDMRGLLHCHSTYSDGKSTLEEMARAAKSAGYEYFGVCDHSQTAAYAGGLKPEAVKRQHAEIDELNAKIKGLTILKGIESDILADGSLDYTDKILESFDLVVVSIHSGFGIGREAMTARVLRAIEHPAATILAHPTGRLLQEREPFEIDLAPIFEAAAKRGVAIEINANPHRLDLDWRMIRTAKKAGCRFAINPDAHHTKGIADVAWGVGIARKGWLEAGDAINTMTLARFRKWLKERGSG